MAVRSGRRLIDVEQVLEHALQVVELGLVRCERDGADLRVDLDGRQVKRAMFEVRYPQASVSQFVSRLNPEGRTAEIVG
jgi:hypothetical protein